MPPVDPAFPVMDEPAAGISAPEQTEQDEFLASLSDPTIARRLALVQTQLEFFKSPEGQRWIQGEIIDRTGRAALPFVSGIEALAGQHPYQEGQKAYQRLFITKDSRDEHADAVALAHSIALAEAEGNKSFLQSAAGAITESIGFGLELLLGQAILKGVSSGIGAAGRFILGSERAAQISGPLLRAATIPHRLARAESALSRLSGQAVLALYGGLKASVLPGLVQLNEYYANNLAILPRYDDTGTLISFTVPDEEQAFRKATAQMVIENVSEMTGPLLGEAGSLVRRHILRSAARPAMEGMEHTSRYLAALFATPEYADEVAMALERAGLRAAAKGISRGHWLDAGRILRQMGWHGLLNEWGEERVADLLNGIVLGEWGALGLLARGEFGQLAYQQAVEATALTVSGGIQAQIARGLHYGAQITGLKPTEGFENWLQKILVEPPSNAEALQAQQQFLNAVSRVAESPPGDSSFEWVSQVNPSRSRLESFAQQYGVPALNRADRKIFASMVRYFSDSYKAANAAEKERQNLEQRAMQQIQSSRKVQDVLKYIATSLVSARDNKRLFENLPAVIRNIVRAFSAETSAKERQRLRSYLESFNLWVPSDAIIGLSHISADQAGMLLDFVDILVERQFTKELSKIRIGDKRIGPEYEVTNSLLRNPSVLTSYRREVAKDMDLPNLLAHYANLMDIVASIREKHRQARNTRNIIPSPAKRLQTALYGIDLPTSFDAKLWWARNVLGPRPDGSVAIVSPFQRPDRIPKLHEIDPQLAGRLLYRAIVENVRGFTLPVGVDEGDWSADHFETTPSEPAAPEVSQLSQTNLTSEAPTEISVETPTETAPVQTEELPPTRTAETPAPTPAEPALSPPEQIAQPPESVTPIPERKPTRPEEEKRDRRKPNEIPPKLPPGFIADVQVPEEESNQAVDEEYLSDLPDVIFAGSYQGPQSQKPSYIFDPVPDYLHVPHELYTNRRKLVTIGTVLMASASEVFLDPARFKQAVRPVTFTAQQMKKVLDAIELSLEKLKKGESEDTSFGNDADAQKMQNVPQSFGRSKVTYSGTMLWHPTSIFAQYGMKLSLEAYDGMVYGDQIGAIWSLELTDPIYQEIWTQYINQESHLIRMNAIGLSSQPMDAHFVYSPQRNPYLVRLSTSAMMALWYNLAGRLAYEQKQAHKNNYLFAIRTPNTKPLGRTIAGGYFIIRAFEQSRYTGDLGRVMAPGGFTLAAIQAQYTTGAKGEIVAGSREFNAKGPFGIVRSNNVRRIPWSYRLETGQDIYTVRGPNGALYPLNFPILQELIKLYPQLQWFADPQYANYTIEKFIDLLPNLNQIQRDGVLVGLSSLVGRRAFALTDSTGTGKTRQILGLARIFSLMGYRVLIIAPNPVLGNPFTGGEKKVRTGSYAQDAKALGLEWNEDLVLIEGVQDWHLKQRERLKEKKRPYIGVTTYNRFSESVRKDISVEGAKNTFQKLASQHSLDMLDNLVRSMAGSRGMRLRKVHDENELWQQLYIAFKWLQPFLDDYRGTASPEVVAEFSRPTLFIFDEAHRLKNVTESRQANVGIFLNLLPILFAPKIVAPTATETPPRMPATITTPMVPPSIMYSTATLTDTLAKTQYTFPLFGPLLVQTRSPHHNYTEWQDLAKIIAPGLGLQQVSKSAIHVNLGLIDPLPYAPSNPHDREWYDTISTIAHAQQQLGAAGAILGRQLSLRGVKVMPLAYESPPDAYSILQTLETALNVATGNQTTLVNALMTLLSPLYVEQFKLSFVAQSIIEEAHADPKRHFVVYVSHVHKGSVIDTWLERAKMKVEVQENPHDGTKKYVLKELPLTSDEMMDDDIHDTRILFQKLQRQAPGILQTLLEKEIPSSIDVLKNYLTTLPHPATNRSLFAQRDIVALHGRMPSVARARAIESFQNPGGARVLITNVQVGGEGINLDDRYGDLPRSVYFVSLPFSAIQVIQGIGRVWRISTKTPVDTGVSVYLVHDANAPHEIDHYRRIETKLEVLHAMIAPQRTLMVEEQAVAAPIVQAPTTAAQTTTPAPPQQPGPQPGETVESPPAPKAEEAAPPPMPEAIHTGTAVPTAEVTVQEPVSVSELPPEDQPAAVSEPAVKPEETAQQQLPEPPLEVQVVHQPQTMVVSEPAPRPQPPGVTGYAAPVDTQNQLLPRIFEGIDQELEPSDVYIMKRTNERGEVEEIEIPFYYMLVPVDKILASHNVTFTQAGTIAVSEAENYPKRLQPRGDYMSSSGKGRLYNALLVQKRLRSSGFQPNQILVDTNQPQMGPPFVSLEGIVLNGNFRMMITAAMIKLTRDILKLPADQREGLEGYLERMFQYYVRLSRFSSNALNSQAPKHRDWAAWPLVFENFVDILRQAKPGQVDTDLLDILVNDPVVLVRVVPISVSDAIASQFATEGNISVTAAADELQQAKEIVLMLEKRDLFDKLRLEDYSSLDAVIRNSPEFASAIYGHLWDNYPETINNYFVQRGNAYVLSDSGVERIVNGILQLTYGRYNDRVIVELGASERRRFRDALTRAALVILRFRKQVRTLTGDWHSKYLAFDPTKPLAIGIKWILDHEDVLRGKGIQTLINAVNQQILAGMENLFTSVDATSLFWAIYLWKTKDTPTKLLAGLQAYANAITEQINSLFVDKTDPDNLIETTFRAADVKFDAQEREFFDSAIKGKVTFETQPADPAIQFAGHSGLALSVYRVYRMDNDTKHYPIFENIIQNSAYRDIALTILDPHINLAARELQHLYKRIQKAVQQFQSGKVPKYHPSVRTLGMLAGKLLGLQYYISKGLEHYYGVFGGLSGYFDPKTWTIHEWTRELPLIIGHELGHGIAYLLGEDYTKSPLYDPNFKSAMMNAQQFFYYLGMVGPFSSARQSRRVDLDYTIHEGFAEFIRMLLTSPKQLQRYIEEGIIGGQLVEADVHNAFSVLDYLATNHRRVWKTLIGTAATYKYLASQDARAYVEWSEGQTDPPEKITNAIRKTVEAIADTVSPEIAWQHVSGMILSRLYGVPSALARMPILNPLIAYTRQLLSRDYKLLSKVATRDIRPLFRKLGALAHYAFAYSRNDAGAALWGVKETDGIKVAFGQRATGRLADLVGYLQRYEQDLLEAEAALAVINDPNASQQDRDSAMRTYETIMKRYQVRDVRVMERIYNEMADLVTSIEYSDSNVVQYAQSHAWEQLHAVLQLEAHDGQLQGGVVNLHVRIYPETLQKIKNQYLDHAWQLLVRAMQLESIIERAKNSGDERHLLEVPRWTDEFDAVKRAFVNSHRPGFQNVDDVYNPAAQQLRRFMRRHLLLGMMAGTITPTEMHYIIRDHEFYAPLMSVSPLDAIRETAELPKGIETVIPFIAGVYPRAAIHHAYVPPPPYKDMDTALASMFYTTYAALYSSERNAYILTLSDKVKDILSRAARSLSDEGKQEAQEIASRIQGWRIRIGHSVEMRHVGDRADLLKYFEDGLKRVIEQNIAKRPLEEEEWKQLKKGLLVYYDGQAILMPEPNVPRVTSMWVDVEWKFDEKRGAFRKYLNFYHVADPLMFHFISTTPQPLDAIKWMAETTAVVRSIYKSGRPMFARFRRLQTQNIVYMLRNIPRDMFTAMTFNETRFQFVPLMALLSGFQQMAGGKGSQVALTTFSRQFLERVQEETVPSFFTMINYWFGADRARFREAFRKWLDYEFPNVREVFKEEALHIRMLGMLNAALSLISWPIELLNRVVLLPFKVIGLSPESTEIAPRLAAYMWSMENNPDHVLATYEGDVITGNFSQHGINTMAKWIQMLPFFNAFLQIARQHWEAKTSADPRRQLFYWLTILEIGLIGYVIRLLFWLIFGRSNGREEVLYRLHIDQDRPAEERMRSISWGGFSMPLDASAPSVAFGLGVTYADYAVLQTLHDPENKDEPYDVIINRLGEQAYNLAWQVVPYRELSSRVLPPEWQTAAELAMNYSFYWNEPVINEYLQRLDPRDVHPPFNSKTEQAVASYLRGFGKKLHDLTSLENPLEKVTPQHIHYWARGTFGSYVEDFMRTVENSPWVVRKMLDRDIKALADVKGEDIPYYRRMKPREPTGIYTASAQDMRSLAQRYERLANTIIAMHQRGEKVPEELLEQALRSRVVYKAWQDLEQHASTLRKYERIADRIPGGRERYKKELDDGKKQLAETAREFWKYYSYFMRKYEEDRQPVPAGR